MKDDNVRITLSELAPRARMLSDSELSNLFGGCQGLEAECSTDKDCCNRYCKPIVRHGKGFCR